MMTLETSHRLIDRVMEKFPDGADITFCFQGGEPTCRGLDFFRDFAAYADQVRKKNHQIHYALQTNGTLLNEEWADFLKERDVLTGVSIDGPPEVHDSVRIYASGEGTYEKVMQSVELLRKKGVEFNILSVLTNKMARVPQKYWNWVLKNHFRYVQVIPCLPGLGGTGSYALTPQEFFHFYDQLFPLWKKEFERGNYISVTLFDNLIPMFAGMAPTQCGYLGFCTNQFVVEADGSVYPCDFYALDSYLLGNIRDNTLDEIAASKALEQFLREPHRSCRQCADCPFMQICGRQCRRVNVCYFNKNFCGYRAFLEKYGKQMWQISRLLSA